MSIRREGIILLQVMILSKVFSDLLKKHLGPSSTSGLRVVEYGTLVVLEDPQPKLVIVR